MQLRTLASNFAAVAVIAIISISPLYYATPAFGDVEMTPFVSLTKPVGLVWDGEKFIASRRNGDTKLVTISADGKTVTPFAPSFSGQDEVYIALSHGKAGFSQGYIYVSSGNSIYQINPSGSEVKKFATPFEGMGLGYIAFDTEGTWGSLLYAVNFNGLFWSVDSKGESKLIVNLGNDLLPESIMIAPKEFGRYAGDMIISLEMGRKVVALSRQSPGTVTVLAEFPGESPERVLPIPAGHSLYIAKYDENTIVKIPSQYLSGYVGGIVVITEGEAGEPGSITVLQAKGDTITIIKLAENILPSPHFEGAAFVPDVLSAKTVTTMVTTVVQTASQTDLLAIGAMAFALVVLVSMALIVRRRGAKKE